VIGILSTEHREMTYQWSRDFALKAYLLRLQKLIFELIQLRFLYEIMIDNELFNSNAKPLESACIIYAQIEKLRGL